ncbi:ATP-binding protein [Thermodesulfobacteriota bacterium]
MKKNLTKEIKARQDTRDAPAETAKAFAAEAQKAYGKLQNGIPAHTHRAPDGLPDEAQYRTVVEDQVELIARYLPDGTLTFVNNSFCRYFGAKRKLLLGTQFAPLVSLEDRETVFDKIKDITKKRQKTMLDFRIILPSGKTRWTRWTASAFFDTSGSIKAYQLVGRDIHEFKRLEEQVQKDNTLLQAVFDGISDPLFILNSDLGITLANTATIDYFNLGAKQTLDSPCHRLFRDRGSRCDGCRIAAMLQRGEGGTFEREGYRSPAHAELVTVVPLEKQGAGGTSAIVHVQDLTRLRILEKRVTHTERLASLGMLISGIAHEINNPNNFISFNIPVLREYLDTLLPIIDDYTEDNPDFSPFGMSYDEFKKDLQKLLNNMEHGSERINQTVSGLRDFVRNEEKKELMHYNLKKIVDRAALLCGSKLKKAVKNFTVSVDNDAQDVFTDPRTLEHIIIILLVNAAEAADKADSYIRLHASAGSTWQDRTTIEIRDNGCGIEEENTEKIFEPFYSTKTSEGGTGLGLYICREMINGLGGRIDLESTPGEGTTVRLIIPDTSRKE